MDNENTTGHIHTIGRRFPTKLELMGLSTELLTAKHLEENVKNFMDENDKLQEQFLSLKKEDDAVNHPSHYTAYKGLEVIDLTEQMNFNRGNAVKYIARAGLKNPDKEIEDLEKAVWYLQREIERIKKLGS